MRETLSACVALLVVLAAVATVMGGASAAPAGAEARSSDGQRVSFAAGGNNSSVMVDSLPDPERDSIGWEAGLWHNETIDVNNTDGMNERERTVAVARAMARVEYVRQLEFPGNETIPINVISRAEYRNQTSSRTNYSESYRTFDNVKFEALLFVGEHNDSIAVQNSNRGSSVLGYYSPSRDSIVLISEGETPSFDGEETLAQEVAHALQDFRFNLTAMRSNVKTRDAYNGQNGLVEGDGNLIDELYVKRCDAEWSCIPAPPSNDSSGGSGDLHFGVYLMSFFPYSDGPVFIDTYYKQGGWDRINQMYENPPYSSEQVIYPEKYRQDLPKNVSLQDRTSGGWERLTTAGDRNRSYATLGQSAMSAMFMYPTYDNWNRSTLLSPFQFLNTDGNGNVNSTDPLNYDLPMTRGWEGDRLHVYTNPEAGENETGYVWRSTWESASDAREFADRYQDLLSYWGGTKQAAGVWTVEESSPFTDAFRVMVDGDTVTIVNAPTVDQLGDVYGPAAISATGPTTPDGETTVDGETRDGETAMNGTTTDDGGTGGGFSPGFGPGAAIVALSVSLVVLARRRN